MGIETEYGILGGPGVKQNPMVLSSLVVSAYADAAAGHGRARWSYEGEDPLADARGWRLDRARAHPSQLTDGEGPRGADRDSSGLDGEVLRRRRPAATERDDPAAVNVLLTNGARLYVDHAHPEYSSPEVTNAHDAVLWDRAGEHVMLASVRALAASPHTPEINLYKNNVDGKGASYGTHENYLVDRAVPFEDIVKVLTPFLVTRPVLVGAGRVGLGPAGEEPGYQISQRADYMEAEVGLETTLRRPIINTRDEPHADPARFRRLHVIIGDANCLEVATYLKLGMTSLILSVLEAGQAPLSWEGLSLADPVAAVAEVSRDLELNQAIDLANGARMSAIEIQRAYLDGVRAAGLDFDAQETAVLERWDRVLTLLATDREAAAREVEWLAKLSVLEGLRRRHHLAWDHPKVAALDLQWSDVRPERGIYARLRAAGAVETLVTQEEAERAASSPPEDTRAYFRGQALRRYPRAVVAAGWNGLVMDVSSQPSLVRIPMTDPTRGTKALVGGLFDQNEDAESFLTALLGGR